MFRLALIAMFVTIAVYTAVVIAAQGANFPGIFIADIAAVGWPGQFNLDFLGFLLLAALWVAWRHGFSPAGWGLGLAALTGGMLFMAAYLLIVSYAARGDVRRLLVGDRPPAG